MGSAPLQPSPEKAKVSVSKRAFGAVPANAALRFIFSYTHHYIAISIA
jgi:hypothetical protein